MANLIVRIVCLIVVQLFMFCDTNNSPMSMATVSTGCAPYTHKNDAIIGNPQNLPKGFFVFDRDETAGLYISSINNYNAQCIPNTEMDHPRCMAVSMDGNWISYIDLPTKKIFLLKRSGCHKMIVPVTVNNTDFPASPGFYRNGPYGEEIFYMADRRTIRSIKLTIEEDTVYFSNDRIIAQLDASLIFNPGYFMQYAIVKDQIFGEISPVIDGSIKSRTGFLTIPDNGRGVARSENIYRWANDRFEGMDGCGHTMSFDGSMALANVGVAGNPECVPKSHKGFVITPFRRLGSEPVDFFTEHVDVKGISINWCPPAFRNEGSDFWGWYFSNNTRYVIGRSLKTAFNGAWIVDWKENIWTPVTPVDSDMTIRQVAVYFSDYDPTVMRDPECACHVCETDTIPITDRYNPFYRVVRPDGGEVFHIGDICTVAVASVREGNAALYISSGKTTVILPGFTHSINPLTDSLYIFTIPENFIVNGKQRSSVADSCRISIRDYGEGNRYYDYSDGFFAIKP